MNKYLKAFLKLLLLLLVLSISIFSGLRFRIPESWGIDFSINVYLMIETFVYIVVGFMSVKIAKILQEYVKIRGDR